MHKVNKTILTICAFLAPLNTIHGMQKEQDSKSLESSLKKEAPLIVIKGDIYIALSQYRSMRYECGQCYDDFNKTNQLGLRCKGSNEPLVWVRLKNLESENWYRWHPLLFTFGDVLPFSLFEHKKENEIISLIATTIPAENKVQKYKIELTCKQYHPDNNDSFETTLEKGKQRFSNTPNYGRSCEKKLLKDQTLEKTVDGKYKHGRFGFGYNDCVSLKMACMKYIILNKDIFVGQLQYLPQDLIEEIDPELAKPI